MRAPPPLRTLRLLFALPRAEKRGNLRFSCASRLAAGLGGKVRTPCVGHCACCTSRGAHNGGDRRFFAPEQGAHPSCRVHALGVRCTTRCAPRATLRIFGKSGGFARPRATRRTPLADLLADLALRTTRRSVTFRGVTVRATRCGPSEARPPKVSALFCVFLRTLCALRTARYTPRTQFSYVCTASVAGPATVPAPGGPPGGGNGDPGCLRNKT